nr:unnamed protein product [Callosobruchus analis]
MPVPHRPARDMALVPAPEQQSTASLATQEGDVQQPRQPASLQGLLRFCMEATKAEDAPHDSEFQAMDDERRKFLENALKAFTVDVVEELQRQINILKNVEQIKAEDDPTRYADAIEKILEFIDNIDTANDFHKIGGFMILYPCLRSPHPKIRAGGCELLAVLCQNNPYCQQVIIDNGFVAALIRMVEEDVDVNVCVKALYAIGGITRDNREALEQFLSHNGLEVVVNTLKRNNDKFITKTTFMLATFCRMIPELKERLTDLDCIPMLISLLSLDPDHSNENIFALLVELVDGKEKCLQQCKEAKYNLKDFIHRYMGNIKQNEEYQVRSRRESLSTHCCYTYV